MQRHPVHFPPKNSHSTGGFQQRKTAIVDAVSNLKVIMLPLPHLKPSSSSQRARASSLPAVTWLQSTELGAPPRPPSQTAPPSGLHVP